MHLPDPADLASQVLLMALLGTLRTPLRVVGSTPDDDALLEAVANGDAKVAVALYDRLRPVVSRTVRRVAPRATDHEDLVQQAFVELVTALRSRPAVRSLDAWASTITARVVYQRMRRQNVEARFAEVNADALEDVATHVDAREQLSHRELVRAVSRHLERLNQRRVQVFVLHDVHGFELKEIAGILDISVANAQSRLVRGREDVRRALEADPELCGALQREGGP